MERSTGPCPFVRTLNVRSDEMRKATIGACRGWSPPPGPLAPLRGGGGELRVGKRWIAGAQSAKADFPMFQRRVSTRRTGTAVWVRAWAPPCGPRRPGPPRAAVASAWTPPARTCVRDARPEGRDGGGACTVMSDRDEGWRRRWPGAVGHGGIVPYGARSPVPRPSAVHAQDGSARVRKCESARVRKCESRFGAGGWISAAARRGGGGLPGGCGAGRRAWSDIHRTPRRPRASPPSRTGAR